MAPSRKCSARLATPDIIKAWGEAYWFLAEILKGREATIREEIEQLEGGWDGWRPFVVADKVRESSVITSPHPAPGRRQAGAAAQARPVSDAALRACRRAGDEAQLFDLVRAERGPLPDLGEAGGERQGGSRFLHDHVGVGDVFEVTPPAGEFFLPEAPQRPVVLLSGGVGLTPMVSMIETIAADHPGLEAHYVHGTMSSATHAMDDHVRSLAQRHGRITIASFYSEPQAGDAPGETHDITGFITTDWLSANTPLHAADIFLCGPRPFLRSMVRDLQKVGVPADRIHFEFFGPTDELLAARQAGRSRGRHRPRGCTDRRPSRPGVVRQQIVPQRDGLVVLRVVRAIEQGHPALPAQLP